MLGLLLAAATYAITAMPFGGVNESASLAANGNVAVLLSHAGGGATRIGVLRADGSTTVLELPPQSVLTPYGLVHEPSFDSVVLAPDGTPFATVETAFEAIGGGGGYDKASFYWDGAWHPADAPGRKRNGQTVAVAAGGPRTFVLEDDHSDVFMTRPDVPAPPAVEAHEIDAGTVRELGVGIATAMRATHVAGYRYAGKHSSMAWLWTNGRRSALGTGVANSVNASGDVVGDDETSVGGKGYPVLWKHGAATRLGTLHGTATGINDSGTIVVDANGSAFVGSSSDPKHGLHALDRAIVGDGWHVTKALAVANTERILAIATRRGHPAQLVVLDPVRR